MIDLKYIEDLSSFDLESHSVKCEETSEQSSYCECINSNRSFSLLDKKKGSFQKHQVKTVMKQFEKMLVSIAGDMQHLEARSMQYINSDPQLSKLPSNIALTQLTQDPKYQAASCKLNNLEKELKNCSKGKKTYYELLSEKDPLALKSLIKKQQEEFEARYKRFPALSNKNMDTCTDSSEYEGLKVRFLPNTTFFNSVTAIAVGV